MTLALSIGSAAIAQIQRSAVVITVTSTPPSPFTGTLPVPSTAGTALVAVVGCSITGLPALSFPAGWTRIANKDDGSTIDIEAWIYPNNPGGISTVTIIQTAGAGSRFEVVLSEWSNVISASTVDTFGVANSSAGTTLGPVTTGNVSVPGELAIAAWRQRIAAVTGVSFTSPAGWTRVADSGGDGATSGHLDIEYLINPVSGVPLAPLLTSDTTTVVAVGFVLVLKSAPQAVDQTAYLGFDSVTLKLNTADFALLLGGRYVLEDGTGGYLLEDGTGALLLDALVPSLGDPVTFTNPGWVGRLVSLTRADFNDRITNYDRVTIAATNTSAAPGGTAPGDLADGLVGGYYQLESGSGSYQLEDGSGNLLQEGTGFPYSGLSVRVIQNIDGTTTTYGQVTVYELGFAAGQTFKLTSQNLGYSAQSFAISNVTTTFKGANPPTPEYLIEFGDAYPTLQKAGGGVLAQNASQASIQAGIAAPAGTLGYAQVTANQTGISAAADLTGLSVTVTVASGRRIRIWSAARVIQNTSAAIPKLTIQEGATVLQASALSLAAAGEGRLTPMVVLTPTVGTHTYKLTLTTGAGTVDMNADATTPAFILVEDIGI